MVSIEKGNLPRLPAGQVLHLSPLGSRHVAEPTDWRKGRPFNVIVYNSDNFGSYIPHIIKGAFEDHVRKERPEEYLELTFNGKTFQFFVAGGVTDAIEFWDYVQECASHAYRQTPEYAQKQVEYKNKVKANQILLDDTLAKLDEMATAFAAIDFPCNGLGQPMREFAAVIFQHLTVVIEAGDHTGVNYSRDGIAKLLGRFNYKKSEFAGGEINTVDRARAYIAGQVIACLVREPFLLNPKVLYFVEAHELDKDVTELREKHE